MIENGEAKQRGMTSNGVCEMRVRKSEKKKLYIYLRRIWDPKGFEDDDEADVEWNREYREEEEIGDLGLGI